MKILKTVKHGEKQWKTVENSGKRWEPGETVKGWENIKNQADILGYSIFHKIYRRETRPF